MFKFEPFVSVVQTGTRMRFPNKDRAEHHLKVLSGPSAFEFKVYTRKEPEPTLLDKSGLVTLQCLIHDWMNAHIYVVDTPWFGKTAKTGSAVIEGVPVGEYDVFVTHPSDQWWRRICSCDNRPRDSRPRRTVPGALSGA